MIKTRDDEHRQGDVNLRKIDSLPEGLTKVDSKVLQPSETAGKNHHFEPTAPVTLYLESENPKDLMTITPDMGKYIVVDEETTLFHGTKYETVPSPEGLGDHLGLRVTPGIYEVIINQEFDYERNEIRVVID